MALNWSWCRCIHVGVCCVCEQGKPRGKLLEPEQKGVSEKEKTDLSSYLSLQTFCPASTYPQRHTYIKGRICGHTHMHSPFRSVIMFGMPFARTHTQSSVKWTNTSGSKRKIMQTEFACPLFVVQPVHNLSSITPVAHLKQAMSSKQDEHYLGLRNRCYFLLGVWWGCAEKIIHPSTLL